MKAIAAALLACIAFPALAAPVKVAITNTGRQPGRLLIAVHNDPNNFPDNPRGAVRTVIIPVTSAQTTAQAELDLPAGDYAIAIILDENRNGRLDTRLGIPRERFGFSKNPQLRMGPPRFSECEVRVEETGATLSINLKKYL